jgi:molecular chaperone IbpA
MLSKIFPAGRLKGLATLKICPVGEDLPDRPGLYPGCSMEDMDMRSALDFTPYRQSWIGFDHLFDLLENARQDEANGFPPFDLEQDSENTYRIRLAVAGFRRDDIDITARPNLLVIAGRRAEEPERALLYRGIATSNFERQFQLADHVVVTGARLNDGMLEVDLERQIPDEVKPRKIDVETEPRRLENAEPKRTSSGDVAAKGRKPQKGEVVEGGSPEITSAGAG